MENAVESKLEGFKPPRVQTVEEQAIEEVSRKLEEAQKLGEKEVEISTKKLTYEERLKEVGLTVDEALRIVDAMAVEGVYKETFSLSPSVKIVLSSRSNRFNSFLARKIDIADPKKIGNLQQLMLSYQLAASLQNYGKVALPELSENFSQNEWEQCLEKRMDFLNHVASPVFLAMANKLSSFDMKLLTIFSEGYEKNF